MIRKIPIEPIRRDNGMWNLQTHLLPLPKGFVVEERNLIAIPAGVVGGNHVHPRTEIFIAVGNLYLEWRDAKGNRHSEAMAEAGQLFVYVVEPYTPHAVVNKGTQPAVLFELADDIQHDVKPAVPSLV